MSDAGAIRPLAAGDLTRIVDIDGAQSGRTRRSFYQKRFAELAADPEGQLALAAERGGRIIGFAFAHLLDGEFGGASRAGVLDAVGVAQEFRGAGVATSLVAHLEQELQRRGVQELRTQADWTEHGLSSFFSSAGFALAPRLVLAREVEEPTLDEFDWTDLPVRSMTEADLPALVRIDKKHTGRDRSAYYRRKAHEALRQSGVRVSLVAEVEGQFAGFLMARVDLGDFGRTEPTAVLDTIGIDPAYAGKQVGRALLEQLLNNLRTLRVERVLTEVEWDHFDLLRFLQRGGFKLSQRLTFHKKLA